MGASQGQLFAGTDMRVYLPGNANALVTIQGLDWKEDQEKTYVHGQGTLPIGLTVGKQSFGGTLKILKHEADAIRRGLPPEKSMLQMPGFTMVSVFETDQGRSSTIRFEGVLFTSAASSSVPSAEAIVETYEFIASNIITI
jgi:hypothetical protein